jgi:hypothetical protein
MRRPKPFELLFATAVALAALLPASGWAWSRHGDVDIEILDDRGHEFRQFPLVESRGRRTERAYLEAERGAGYSIRVRNRTKHRIGLVIAVDGRNIISGKKSYLDSDERKYVLRPHESAEYDGWRTGKHKVNRFYFTDAGDSYADAFRDRSAMGVIAVAVFREKERHPRRFDDIQAYDGPETRHGAPKKAQPGTGFGETEWSPSRQVRFEPEHRPMAEYFFKYEWRSTLCRKGIIECRRHDRGNRFWPDDGFAPPPPSRGERRLLTP